MKAKILAALKESNKRFGLSDDTLSALVDSCGVTEESGIEGWVKLMEPVLSAMQKYGDKRANDAAKKTVKTEDGDLAKQLGEMRQSLIDELKAQLQPDDTLKKEYEALKLRLDNADAERKKSEFLDKLKRVGRENGISEGIVSMSTGSFTSDMDDKAISEKFAELKKELIAQGLPEAGFHQMQTTEESARKTAKDWLEDQMKQQQAQSTGDGI